MAALKEQVKIFIVQALACMDTPQQVANAVKQEFNIEIDRKQVQLYDPTKAAGKNLSKKYKDLFHKTREDFKKNVYDIPLANKAYRLKELQKIYEDWKNNRLMKQGVIKQVREEMQGYDLMLLNLELKQLEIEKLREGEGDEDPTPVKVTIQVVDASKKDAEYGIAIMVTLAVGLVAAVVLMTRMPRSPQEWAVGLICTVVSSLAGGSFIIVKWGLHEWVTDVWGMIALGGFFFVCGLPGWALVRWIFNFIDKQEGKTIVEVIKEFKKARKDIENS